MPTETETRGAATIAALRGVCAADNDILEIHRAARVETIRARLAAASTGPWYADAVNGVIRILWNTSTFTRNKIATVLRSDRNQHADADLIAHAPTDLAWLLDENDRLHAERDLLLEHTDTTTMTAYWALRAQGRQEELKATRR
jgi:hypothetical protein